MMKKLIKALMVIMLPFMCNITVFAEETPSIPVEVTLEGTLSDPAEDFVVKMEAEDASYPMPEGTEDGVYTLTINGAGKASIPSITFDKVGIYTYKVYQEKTDKQTVKKLDDTVYTITIYVTNPEEGQEGLQITVNKETNDKKQEIVFNNEYETVTPSPKPSSKPGSPATPTPTSTPISRKGLVDTGDTSSMWLFAAVSGVAVVGLGILFFVRKKYSED